MSTQENLEERIERIRKRNEELQKRHAEAEADKQRARKDNAMVQTKLTNYDDWPKEHKYDKVDFKFEKDDDDHNVANNDMRDKKSERFRKSQFADGDGPPPDPSYSFLKDADRDFNRTDQTKVKTNTPEKLQWTNRDQAGQQQRGRGGQNRGNYRGGNRGRSSRGGFNHHRNDSHPEYDAWRSERNRIDEARINRQRNSEGKWRREWDVEKIDNDVPIEIEHTHKPDRLTVGDVLLSGTKKTLTADSTFDKVGNRGRPNITVSLNKTGEVQKVKVTSPPVIGSGRVGPRQIKPRAIFSDESCKNKMDENFDHHKSRGHHIDVRQSKKKEKSRSPKHAESLQPQSQNVDRSVQNRLNKYKQPNDFTELSKELLDVSAEIEGIYTSVENLNKKHNDGSVIENFGELLLKNDSGVDSEDFSLSTDLVLDSTYSTDSCNENTSQDLTTKCNFGDMKTHDIENYIEREVQKNICLTPDSEERTDEHNLKNELLEINSEVVCNELATGDVKELEHTNELNETENTVVTVEATENNITVEDSEITNQTNDENKVETEVPQLEEISNTIETANDSTENIKPSSDEKIDIENKLSDTEDVATELKPDTDKIVDAGTKNLLEELNEVGETLKDTNETSNTKTSEEITEKEDKTESKPENDLVSKLVLTDQKITENLELEKNSALDETLIADKYEGNIKLQNETSTNVEKQA